MRIQEIVNYLQGVAEKRGKTFSELQPDVSFMDAGILDSLSLLDFISFIEKRFGMEIPGHDIVPENFGTLAAATRYVGQRLEQGEPR